jgi:hypothetical protein
MTLRPKVFGVAQRLRRIAQLRIRDERLNTTRSGRVAPRASGRHQRLETRLQPQPALIAGLQVPGPLRRQPHLSLSDRLTTRLTAGFETRGARQDTRQKRHPPYGETLITSASTAPRDSAGQYS